MAEILDSVGLVRCSAISGVKRSGDRIGDPALNGEPMVVCDGDRISCCCDAVDGLDARGGVATRAAAFPFSAGRPKTTLSFTVAFSGNERFFFGSEVAGLWLTFHASVGRCRRSSVEIGFFFAGEADLRTADAERIL